MKNLHPLFRSQPAEDSVPADLTRTVRIEHDRRHLAFAAIVSGAAAAGTLGWFCWRIAHPTAAAPLWTLVPFGIGAVAAVLGMLRNVYRLQDGDPAIVISPRGLQFRPAVLGETARIPWSAIRGVASKRHKNMRYLVFEVEEADRYGVAAGLFGHWRPLAARGAPTGRVAFTVPMSGAAWTRLDALVHRYFARYATPSANHQVPHVAAQASRSVFRAVLDAAARTAR